MKKIVVGDCFDDDPPIVIDDTHPYADHCFQVVNCLGDLPIYLDRWEIQARYKLLPTLRLPISEPWFSRILSGEKTEEYREIAGENETFKNCALIWGISAKAAKAFSIDLNIGEETLVGWILQQNQKPFKVIHLTNGYGHHRPQLWAHIKEITIGRGNPEWGAPGHDVFIIKLGEVFHTKNLKVVN